MSNGRELHRDMQKGKLAGVCAGVAEYFGWELWMVRIVFISGFLLTGGSFFLLAYIVGWLILDKKPTTGKQTESKLNFFGHEDKTRHKVEVKSRVWQAGEPPVQAFQDIDKSFDSLEQRLRKMESYVTSSEFQLNREFSKL
ncbi:envelope stress response membrane protein PspC [Alteromonas sp. a30]|uniref:envelope stress response membrane protein PspC n=1 Tax=Alteromonas sp. a30 TaxID=2730917 RepID=UPI0022815176|nr:envelope stress response membrane protein PspC [Alteromonas sp. a30]MCY7295969.1 envelope stress response membrane protein PspC [Alteromonas sp. a30]